MKMFLGLNEVSGRMGGAAAAPWVRPASWLALPELGPTEQKFVGLLAIYDNDSQYVALMAAGGYTVDWGDGSAAENVASGVTAQHKYSYAAISAATAVYEADGIAVRHRQVVVTVTMQAGQTLTSFSLQKRHSAMAAVYDIPWLDINLNGPSLSTIAISLQTQLVTTRCLERVGIGVISGSITDFTSMFQYCNSLASVPLFNTAAGTNFSYMFQSCTSLASVPLFNTAAGTNFTSMFQNCNSLASVPLFNTAAGTNFTNMFYICYSLASVPAFNLSYNAARLRAPALTTGNWTMGTGWRYLTGPNSLDKNADGVGTVTPTAATNIVAVQPYKITFTVSAISGGTLSYTLGGTAGPEVLSAATTYTHYVTSAVANTNKLILTPSATGVRVNITAIVIEELVLTTGMFTSCSSLARSLITGLTQAISYISCRLSTTEIVEVFTNLGTADASATAQKTIVVTSNPGTAGLTAPNIAVATGKGWTVTT